MQQPLHGDGPSDTRLNGLASSKPDLGGPTRNDRALTGLRGVAALMIVTHHYMLLGLSSRPLWPEI